MDNPLCDVVQTKSGARPVFPSKISVGTELAKLCNWHKETTKLEAGDSILSFLDKVFGVKIHRYHPRDIEAFQDPIWRISNLYSIRLRDGSVIRFRPRPQQLAVLEMLFVHGHKRIITLKARQIGFTTLLGVVCCDQLCFNPGQQINLIDQTLEDARQKLKNIVVLAYDSMAVELRAGTSFRPWRQKRRALPTHLRRKNTESLMLTNSKPSRLVTLCPFSRMLSSR